MIDAVKACFFNSAVGMKMDFAGLLSDFSCGTADKQGKVRYNRLSNAVR